MPRTSLIGGFDQLDKIESEHGGGNGAFSQLGALRTVRLLPTPPDNKLNIRFLASGFAMVKVHGYMRLPDGKRQSILCRKTFGEECGICAIKDPSDEKGRNYYPSNRGVALVGIVNDKEEPILETIEDTDVSHYDSYAAVMDEANIENDHGTLKMSKVPQVRLLEMGYNFWKTMRLFNEKYGTLNDRSYMVMRAGEGLKTEYSVIPNDKDPNFRSADFTALDFNPGQSFCMSVEDYVDKFLGRQKPYDDFLSANGGNVEKAAPAQAEEQSLASMLD